ncbi:MAG: hypothetical protein V4795_00055 [Pseudomonadota bacterium]
MTLHQLSTASGLLILGLSGLPALAQVDPISTTAGLKAACEGNAGNLVVITSGVTVNTGYPAGAPEQVRSGCRIQLTGGASMQFDKVGLAFAGPLAIIADSKSSLQLQEASLAAPQVLVQFTHMDSGVKMEQSRIDATAGHLDLQIGIGNKIEVSGARTAGVPLSRAAFAATGHVRISASRLHSAVYKDTGMVAGGTVSVTASGADTSIVFDNSGAHAYNGDVRFDLTSSRSKLEASNAAFTAVAGHVALSMRGAEGGLKLSGTAVQAGASAQVISTGPKTEVLVDGGSITARGSILLEGYTAGFDGVLLVSNLQISGGSDVRMLTGLRGKTMVFDNRINAAGLVQSATRTWGVCEANNNQVTAPLVQLCL